MATPPENAESAAPGMVWVPGGSFVMGSNAHYPEERPAHPRRVDGFWMDRTAVTNAEFARFVAETGYVTTAELPPDAAEAAALAASTGADQAVDITLHDQLKNGLGNAAQQIALIMLGQKLGQVHVGLGHRGLRKVRG